MKIVILLFRLSIVSFAQNLPEKDDGNRLLGQCGPLVNEMDSNSSHAEAFSNGR